MRRGSIFPPRRNRLRSALVWRAPAASRSSAAFFWAALGPAADARLPVPCRDALKPPRSRPTAPLVLPVAFFFAIPFSSVFRLSVSDG